MPSEKNSYLSLKGEGRAEAVIKGSRFIAHVGQVVTREDFKAFLESEKELYPDATHHCWAFRIGIERPEELSSDDGEPSGSAGMPIQRVLAGAEVVNAACIVTRYYGGTKLGVGGLMRAYSQTASEAVRDTGIEEKIVTDIFTVCLPYPAHGEFVSNVERLGGMVISSKFGVDVKLKIELPKTEMAEIAEIAANLTHGNAQIDVK